MPWITPLAAISHLLWYAQLTPRYMSSSFDLDSMQCSHHSPLIPSRTCTDELNYLDPRSLMNRADDCHDERDRPNYRPDSMLIVPCLHAAICSNGLSATLAGR